MTKVARDNELDELQQECWQLKCEVETLRNRLAAAEAACEFAEVGRACQQQAFNAVVGGLPEALHRLVTMCDGGTLLERAEALAAELQRSLRNERPESDGQKPR